MSGDDPIRIALLLAERGRLSAEYHAFVKRTSDDLTARGVPFTRYDGSRGSTDTTGQP